MATVFNGHPLTRLAVQVVAAASRAAEFPLHRTIFVP
jgi:hypothetical protein